MLRLIKVLLRMPEVHSLCIILILMYKIYPLIISFCSVDIYSVDKQTHGINDTTVPATHIHTRDKTVRVWVYHLEWVWDGHTHFFEETAIEYRSDGLGLSLNTLKKLWCILAFVSLCSLNFGRVWQLWRNCNEDVEFTDPVFYSVLVCFCIEMNYSTEYHC